MAFGATTLTGGLTTTSVGAITQNGAIGTGAGAEYRVVKEVISGAALEVTEALFKDHVSTDLVVRTVDLSTTVLTWSTGRVASNKFATVILDGIGLDGRHLVVTIGNALSDGKLDVEMSDSAVAGSAVTFTGYYDGASPQLCPVSISIG